MVQEFAESGFWVPGGRLARSIIFKSNKIDQRQPTAESFGNFQLRNFMTLDSTLVAGGQLDPGESLIEAVRREGEEEAGILIDIRGILEVTCLPGWRRVVFYGEPSDLSQLPKTIPDYESSGACWVSHTTCKIGRFSNCAGFSP